MDDNTFKTLSLLVGLVSTLGLAFITYLTLVANQNALIANRAADTAARRATEAVQEVKQTLEVTTSATTQQMTSIAETTKATHVLVNSNFGLQLLATLRALIAVRALTTEPEARMEADAAVAEAQRLYNEHLAKQAIVDAAERAKKPPPSGPPPESEEAVMSVILDEP